MIVLAQRAARAAITIVGLFTLFMVVPTIAVPWLHFGSTGLGARLSLHPVLQPVRGLPAARAGVRKGDRLVSMQPDHRVLYADTAIRIVVERDGRLLTYDLRAGPPVPLTNFDKIVQVCMVALSSTAIFISFFIAVRQLTWVTALLAISSMNFGFQSDSIAVWGLVLSTSQIIVLNSVLAIMFVSLPTWSFALFALAFPRSLWSRGRAVLTVVVFVVAVAQMTMLPAKLVNLAELVPLIGAFFAFVFSYWRAPQSDRPRLTWLTIAAAAFLFINVLGFVVNYFNTTPIGFGVVYRIGSIATTLIWFVIVYAVWRRHVVGIAFAVSRGLVAALITLLLLGIVSVARWAGEHVLEHNGIAGLLGVGLTVLVGYGLNRIAAPAQSVIEQFIFRRKYAAERRLQQAIASMPYAKSRATVASIVIDEACHELRIASAALFLANGDVFERVRAIAWPDESVKRIDADDRLPRVLSAEGRMQKLRDLRWLRQDVPTNDAEPIVAYPLGWHGALTGFVLYGRHSDGSDLDPQEHALLKQLADKAAVSYETAEIAEMRRQLASLEQRRFTLGHGISADA